MAKRASLATFAPQVAAADGAVVTNTKTKAAPPPVATAKAYPKVSVYLNADEVRMLKLLGVDSNTKVSDICAMAIREWLERNGHARGKIFKA